MAIDLDYLYRRILVPDELELPGEGTDAHGFADEAAEWSRGITRLTHAADDFLDGGDEAPLYLTEEQQRKLSALLVEVRALDDGPAGYLAELAYDVALYLDNYRARERGVLSDQHG